MLNNLEKEIRDTLVDKIEEINRFENYDMSDFVFQLWEEENVTGSCTCNAFESQKWIAKHFQDLASYTEEYEQNYGVPLCNPFSRPEAFQVIMCIEVSLNLIGRIWEDGITKEYLITNLKNI